MRPEELHKTLCFSFVWKHPVAFRDFFIPQGWNQKEPYKTRYYQMPPALTRTKIMKTGRGLGKSLDLEFSILHTALNKPGEETIISSFRRVHIKDRCEAIIKYLAHIPYLSQFADWRRVNRTPIYSIPLVTGNTIYGASVGEDPNATAIIGKHPSTRAIDEMEVFPKLAWTQFIETRAEKGSDDIFVGVPNGIIGMPFTDIQKDETYSKCFFRISRTMNPYWDRKRKASSIASFGSEDSDEYKQQVHGEDGSPVQGVWPIENLMRLMSRKIPAYVRTIVPKDLENYTIDALLYDLPFASGETMIGIDVGYSEPTVVCIFEKGPKYRLIARINMQDKVIFDTQEDILDYIFDFYQGFAGIDTSGADGREIYDSMTNPKGRYAPKNYIKRLVEVSFQKKITKQLKDGEPVEEEIKPYSTLLLLKMIYDEMFELPYDEDILEEFSQERKKKTVNNRTVYTTTSTDHIISAFRCFAIAKFVKETVLYEKKDYALPTWGEGISYGQHTQSNSTPR